MQNADKLISDSPLFDRRWYLESYPAAARSGLDPVLHYLWVGGPAGWHPGPRFNAQAYRTRYPAAAAPGMSPLLHYEREGRAAGHVIEPADPAYSGLLDLPPPPGAEALFADMEQRVAGTRPGLGFTRRPAAEAARDDADYAGVTPTGDRAVFFNRCLHMVTTQTRPPRQWVVVDDGDTALSDQMHIPDWVTYVRRPRDAADPPHTLSINVLQALEYVEQDRVLIMEDDDWYAPTYAEFLLPYLDRADLVGLNKIVYYHLQGNMWKTGTPPRHTAFAQSAFRRGHAWDHLAAVCRTNFTEIREKGVLDRHWWQTFEGRRHLIARHPCLHVGFKGAYGRTGLADGHRSSEPDYVPDPDQAYLQACIGGDIAYYKRWLEVFHKPYAVYTVARPEDSLPDLEGVDRRQVDLYAFSDTALPDPGPWQAIPFDASWDDPVAKIAKCRSMPHLYFPEHAWSLWVEPGTPLPRDPAALIADAIDRRIAIAVEGAGHDETAGGPDESVPDRPLSEQDRYLRVSSRLILRRHGDRAVEAAMALWQAEPRSGHDGGAAGLSHALRQAGILPGLLSSGGVAGAG